MAVIDEMRHQPDSITPKENQSCWWNLEETNQEVFRHLNNKSESAAFIEKNRYDLLGVGHRRFTFPIRVE